MCAPPAAGHDDDPREFHPMSCSNRWCRWWPPAALAQRHPGHGYGSVVAYVHPAPPEFPVDPRAVGLDQSGDLGMADVHAASSVEDPERPVVTPRLACSRPATPSDTTSGQAL